MKGWLDNYNDSKVSAPEGFQGEGYSMKGRNYSPAWGGQFQMGGYVYPVNYVPQAQMGGSIPGAVGFSYARTQSPAPSNGKYAKKTMASAQDGKKVYPEFKKIVAKSDEEKLRESLKERPRAAVRDNTAVVTKVEKGKQKTVNPNQQVSTKYNAEKQRKEIVAERKAKIKDSILAQDEDVIGNPNWREVLARETQATGDKFRLFPEEDSFFDNYLNPGVMIGSMASNLGQAPYQAKQNNSYLPYITSIGTPLAIGALAGVGANSNTQFVNNLINPLAGTKDILNKSINYIEKKGVPLRMPEYIKNDPNLYLQGLVPNVNNDKFLSEINWGKWNKEIPNNTQLMKEYNAIEQTSKANGSWMKNSDGSPFQGTPEQFVQQNSENFKNAFGKTKLIDEHGKPMILHHGHFTNKDFSSFLPSKRSGISNSGYEGDYSFFTPHKSLAEDYAGIGMVDDIPGYKSHVKSVYINSENPLLDSRTEFADIDIPKSLREGRDAITPSLNPKEFSEVAIPYGNNVKSATGNNGMFDMTNPNIYKAMLPIGLGLGAASQLDQKREGGVIKDDMGQWAHPGEITEIGSNQITMEGVPYPVLGISDTGDMQMMYPEEEYEFDGKKVTEFPMARNGLRQEQKGLQNLDNLTNFTNYNKPQPGGWLNKYN